jgi:hypothetical protein
VPVVGPEPYLHPHRTRVAESVVNLVTGPSAPEPPRGRRVNRLELSPRPFERHFFPVTTRLPMHGTHPATARSPRMVWFCRSLFIAVAAIALVAAAKSWGQINAPGYNPYKLNESVWHRMDLCREQAQKQFPDATPEAYAKRDRATQRCLSSQMLPPEAPLGALRPQDKGSSSSDRP